ncbi:MAG: hypothetical protein AAFO29_13250, partial [Actinomycetota bacterium]
MAQAPVLHLDGLRVVRTDRPQPLVEDLTIRVEPGQTHVLIGPAGAGPEAVAPALAGSPDLAITAGQVLLHGDDIAAWPADTRPRAGLFVAFGQPPPLPGVTLAQVVSQAVATRTGQPVDLSELRAELAAGAEVLGAAVSLLDHDLGQPRTAVEVRQGELLQMLALDPGVVVLDEPAADLADEAIGVLVDGLASVRDRRPTLGTLAST